MAAVTVKTWRPPPRTLASIHDPEGADLYPRHVFEGAETALILFAAGFHGRQDAYWAAEAGVRGTCVDHDAKRLGEMQLIYPDGWSFHVRDVFEFADHAHGRHWDVVSLDPWSGLFQECADCLPLWCSLASKNVVLGRGVATTVDPPDGWTITETLKRSKFNGGIYWTVISRV